MVDKVIHLNGVFTKDGLLPTTADKIDSIYIEGFANTTSIDRSGDIITQDAWNKGMENYLKNPIILAQHDHDEPIGRMVEHKISSKGLWVKARISAAAEDTFNLIKDGVLTTFSVGFIIKDAMYDAATDLFVIKDLELLEISVVSVPCNQDSTFSISKSFASDSEAREFKKKYVSGTSDLDTKSTNNKEFNMDQKEIEKMLAEATAKAAKEAADAVIKAQAEAAAKEAAAKAAEAEVEAKIEKALAARIEVGQTGAEKLLAEVEKRFAESTEATKSVLAGLEASLAEKSKELEALQKSKMNFADKGSEAVTYAEKEEAVLLSKFSRKGMTETVRGREIVEKAGGHTNSATWETEVSLNLESDIRRKLVVAPILRNINMTTNVMKLPLNPDAGIGTWMANTAFGTTESTGPALTHALGEITLSAYKVATLEFMNFEEEEDSLIVLLPIIRDAMVRRVSRALDRAFLGAGTSIAPFNGLAVYDTTSTVVPTNTGAATMTHMRSLRKDLGVWGLDPSSLYYIVSQDVYYDLLEDTSFQSVLQVGQQNATLLTGQVGMIGQTPVLVSGEFPTKAGGAATAATNIGAICVAPGNFIAGTQRGLRLDVQDEVQKQRTALVASMRAGLTTVSNAQGVGVSTLRWS